MDESIYYPAYIDGRTVVILRRTRLGFEIVESGCLSYNGTTLWLESKGAKRVIGDEEISTLKVATPENQIPHCRGFDFFCILDSKEPTPPAPKRRWRRFSLRALFIALTVLACLGGWVTNQMHQRERMLRKLRPHPPLGGIGFTPDLQPKPFPWTTPAAWIRPVRFIELNPRFVTEKEAEEISKLFPEATVRFAIRL